MNNEIEKIKGRYKDKHQQYNNPIKMWDDIQVTLSHISTLEEKVKEDHKFYKLVNDRAIAAEVKRDELDSINTGLSEALAAALDDFSKAEVKIKELEDNLNNPEWCCTKHKTWLVERAEQAESRIKELELRIAGIELPAQNYNKTLARAEELEIQLNQERKDKNAWLTVYQEKVRELERQVNIYKDERDELRSLHDAGCREAYRICDLEDDGEYRWKWVLLELSSQKKLREKLEQAESHLKEITDKWESLKFKMFDLEEKVRELEGQRDALNSDLNIEHRHTIKLEEKVKELQEERDGYKNGQIQLQGMVDDLMDVNTKWVGKVKELDSELSKWEVPHEDSELEDMKEQSEQSSLSAKQAYINALEWKIKHVELNFKRLQEAVDRHRQGRESMDLEQGVFDEELYKVRDEV